MFIDKRNIAFYLLIVVGMMLNACHNATKDEARTNQDKIRLITLDPGHFHAALVQKSMYPQIDSVVYVYSPGGQELQEQLNLIDQYNHRKENPTHWVEKVYTGNDFLEKMVEEKQNNPNKGGADIVVIAGNNLRKTEYIKRAIDAGMNVLADKPMAINTAGFDMLKHVFADAKEKGVILYDIMTERSEITTILQKALAHNPAVFGELKQGTADSPTVVMESVHRYFKQVSGKPLIRPDWFFDPLQEGDAIVDVGTHLVDQVQWVCFPGVSLDYSRDIHIQSSKVWPSPLTLSEFSNITKEDHFPDFLNKYVKDDSILLTHGNGTINYTIKGIHTRITTKWTYDAPQGAGDTYYSLLAGTTANLEIRQGEEESWQPALYVWPTKAVKDIKEFIDDLENAMKEINKEFPGVSIEKYKNGWKVSIPEKYRQGHEAHFAEAMKRYLQYLKDGKLPGWEVPGMIAKYYTTTKALEMAQQR